VLGVELDASWADLTGGTRAVRFTDGTGLLFLDTSIRERVHVAKVGINYRFGWAPVGVIY
jgi:hypothetical protein